MSNSTLCMGFPVKYFDNCIVVQLPKYLTSTESIALQELCLELIEQNKTYRKIILDFYNTRLVDSTSIDALVKIHIYVRAYKQRLTFQRVSSLVIDVFIMADLTEVFEINPV